MIINHNSYDPDIPNLASLCCPLLRFTDSTDLEAVCVMLLPTI